MKGIRKQIFPISGRNKPGIKGPLVERIVVKTIPRVSQTYFKDAVPKKIYSFKEQKYWEYQDRRFQAPIQNPISPLKSKIPHLILYDESGESRFTLSHYKKKGELSIMSIQRERTKGAYRTDQGTREKYWLANLEKQASDTFREKLGGRHPAEFLLSEFIYRHRKEATKIYLMLARHADLTKTIYKPLIERFFKSKPRELPHDKYWDIYDLNLERMRVKQILGI